MNVLLLPSSIPIAEDAIETVQDLNSLKNQKSVKDLKSVTDLEFEKPIEPTSYTVTDIDQINHVSQVLKAKVGDTLKVGQLGGKLGKAVIDTVSSTRLVLTHMRFTTLPPAKLDLMVILALPRPKVLRRLIMDMTAMGVAHIVLVNSYRTQKSYWQSPILNRLDEFVLEGLQQGVDTHAPTISLYKRFKPFVEDEMSFWTQQRSAVVAHPYAEQSWSAYQQQSGLPQILCIGAEGGWIDYEIQLLLDNGCQSVNVGSRILRTEAAVNALCGRYL